MTKAEIGKDLVLHGSHKVSAGHINDNGAVTIGLRSYYIMDHGLLPSSGGNNVNEYSLILDVKIPALGVYYSIYQTDLKNRNDGDVFIGPDANFGVGQTGYTPPIIEEGEWYRLGIVVKNDERIDYYVDGAKMLIGEAQAIDSRFSLDPAGLLLFADEDGEDNEISVADVKLYANALSDKEVKALGSCHPLDLSIEPYLQTPTPTSIYVCWHVPGSNESKIEYGQTEALGATAHGESQELEDGDIWHWVKLTDLQPETYYYYKAITDTNESEIYRLKTAPGYGENNGHIRFAVLGDTRTYPAQFSKVVAAIKDKVETLYSGPIEENLNLFIHVGDVVSDGNVLPQYKREYFEPLAQVTANVPVMVSIGDHEHDAEHYYTYMKYEDFAGSESEYYYSFQYGRALFIALYSINGGSPDAHIQTQLDYLEKLLIKTEADTTIDWVFAFTHRPGHSEIWPDGNEYYVQDLFIPMLSKYSKADLLVYGHSHNYERGQVPEGSLRLMLNGGGGAELDRWREYPNQRDYPEIQKSFDYWCYTIFDIDLGGKSFEAKSYTIGHDEKSMDNVLFDQFIRNKADETPPAQPKAETEGEVSFPVQLQASAYSGVYEILSSQFQISKKQNDFTKPVKNVSRDFENIYFDTGAPDFTPIDKNAGIDLTRYTVEGKPSLKADMTYWWRVRYRDRNLQWSEWSEANSFFFTETRVNEKSSIKKFKLNGNYPNPFNPSTAISYTVPNASHVHIAVYDVTGRLVNIIQDGKQLAGDQRAIWNATDSRGKKVSAGIYFYRIIAGNHSGMGKLMYLD